MGVSRSAAIILGYLIKYKNMTYEEARDHVQQCRPAINPNPGFVQQLHVWTAIKNHWNNRRSCAEYCHWRIAHTIKVIASIAHLRCN